MTIKEYAQSQGITYQAVSESIKRHKKELTGHIKTLKGVKNIDDFAVDFLDNIRKDKAVLRGSVETDESLKAEIDKLREEKEALQKKYDEALNKIIELTPYQVERQYLIDELPFWKRNKWKNRKPLQVGIASEDQTQYTIESKG